MLRVPVLVVIFHNYIVLLNFMLYCTLTMSEPSNISYDHLLKVSNMLQQANVLVWMCVVVHLMFTSEISTFKKVH